MNIEVTAPKGLKWDWPLQHNDDCVAVTDDDAHFEVGLDAKYFTPNEVEVKVIGDLLEIMMEHKAKKQSVGEASRSIIRCYQLPKNVDKKTLKSRMDAKGILHIEAEKLH